MAGSSSRGDGGKKRARIEVIPLIDVIFFLLATFILFTLSLNKSNGLKVELPASQTAEVRDPAGAVTITVTAEGTLAWNQDPITLNEFLDRLRAYKSTSDNPKILINGDKNSYFSQAIYVFDEVRKIGINKVLIDTRVRPAGT